MTQVRHPQDTFSSTVRIVLPNDTNTLGNLMGGNLLHWMDIAAAVSANRHCRRVVVTAAVNNVSFDRPIKLGDIVIIESQVTRSFNSSGRMRSSNASSIEMAPLPLFHGIRYDIKLET